MLVMVIMCVTVCNPARSRMRLGLGKSDVAFVVLEVHSVQRADAAPRTTFSQEALLAGRDVLPFRLHKCPILRHVLLICWKQVCERVHVLLVLCCSVRERTSFVGVC